MKSILYGIKSYILLMLTTSSILTLVTGVMMFLFEPRAGQNFTDALEAFWVKWYFTGYLLGVATYKFHIVGLAFFGLINYMDENR